MGKVTHGHLGARNIDQPPCENRKPSKNERFVFGILEKKPGKVYLVYFPLEQFRLIRQSAERALSCHISSC